jgi:hypothetical protein
MLLLVYWCIGLWLMQASAFHIDLTSLSPPPPTSGAIRGCEILGFSFGDIEDYVLWDMMLCSFVEEVFWLVTPCRSEKDVSEEHIDSIFRLKE